MAGTLAACAIVIATADLGLIVISWKRRTVLGGVAGVLGIGLVAFAIASSLRGDAADAALVIALIFLIVGGVLFGLGQAVERLLDEQPEDWS
jgi:uncharacterized membrane protein YczE